MSTREKTNFSPSTKQVIAAAVSWQCSVPLCNNPALGADDGSTLNGGTACHIFSAGENGPRGRGGLTEAQLASASNGIWCCAYHGRVIDANEGSSFPAAQLHMWKRLAEGRVRRAMAVEFAELGWFQRFSLSINTRGGGRWEVAAELQKNNLLVAPTAAGKSLLLEALASISDGRHAWRVRDFPRYSVDLAYETLTRETVAQVSCLLDEALQRKLGGRDVVLPPPDMVVLYLTPELRIPERDFTGVTRLTKLLGVDGDTLHELAKSVSANPDAGMSITLKDTEPDEFEPGQEVKKGSRTVFVKLAHQRSEFPFNALSGGERIRVATALLIALARSEVKARPVLLCIDALWQLDDQAFRGELRRLAEEHIQLLVVSPHELTDEQARKDFPGWNLLRIPSIEDELAKG